MLARWVLILLMAAASHARATVADSGPGGFTLKENAHIAAPPGKVYAALVAPARWWDSAHTFSHSAASLSLAARAGGCWCETLPGGGSVQHMVVVYAQPGQELRLRGVLGPMQAWAAEGTMTWALLPAGSGTDVRMTYAIGGYAPGGVGLIAPVADAVMGAQVARLKSLLEIGTPDRIRPRRGPWPRH